MPQVLRPEDSSMPLHPLPRQSLEKSDVDSFLEFLFKDVAHRPQELRLSEGASVARYIAWLALQGVPNSVLAQGSAALTEYQLAAKTADDEAARWNGNRIANKVWGVLRQNCAFDASSKQAALRFLRRHSKTYFDNPYLRPALEFIENFDLPTDANFPFGPPALLSGSMSVQGRRTPRLVDDLSDRIFAAYYALRRAGVKHRTPSIAKALTTAKIRKREKGRGIRTEWDWTDVNDRVKGYEKTKRKKLAKLGQPRAAIKQMLADFKEHRVDYWISSFKFAKTVESRRSESS